MKINLAQNLSDVIRRIYSNVGGGNLGVAGGLERKYGGTRSFVKGS